MAPRKKSPKRKRPTLKKTTNSAESRFALGLGANLGRPEETLAEAIDQLAAALGPLRVAALYRSPAISPIRQPDFLNTAVTGITALAPSLLLAIAKRIEFNGGRRLAARWAPRPLDIDLLLVGSQSRHYPELTLPHPRLRLRRFVLAPLAELHPDWALPPDGQTAAALLHAVGQEETVVKLDWTEPRLASPTAG